MCSAITSDCRPLSSIARAKETVSMESSLTNVEMPNFMGALYSLCGVGNSTRWSTPVGEGSGRVPAGRAGRGGLNVHTSSGDTVYVEYFQCS